MIIIIISDSHGILSNRMAGRCDDFPVPLVKLTQSAAPVNHQRHVLDTGVPFSTSSAPQGFKHHVTAIGEVPISPPPIETYCTETSIISFRRGVTSMTNSSLASVSTITIADLQHTPINQSPVPTCKTENRSQENNGQLRKPLPKIKPSRLEPIPNHKLILEKLGPSSPNVKRLKRDAKGETVGRHTPTDARSLERVKPAATRAMGRNIPAVMNHSLSVSNYDARYIDSVSVVDD